MHIYNMFNYSYNKAFTSEVFSSKTEYVDKKIFIQSIFKLHAEKLQLSQELS